MGYNVYKITNLMNGKAYVGKSKNTKVRFQAHIRGDGKYKNKQYSLISKAISKYGLDNFEFEILKTFDDPLDMNSYELLMISEHDTIKPKGYNLRHELDDKYCVHEDTKKLLSNIGQGIRHAQKDDILSEYIGVIPIGNRFRTFVRINHKIKSKSFDTEICAAKAYDRMVLFIYGESARLNFNDSRSLYLLENLSEFYNQFLTPENPKTSNYKGVSRYRDENRWVVKLDRKRYKKIPKLDLKIYSTELEAAKTYDKIMYNFYPDFISNFPVNDYSNTQQFIDSHLTKNHSKYPGVCKNTKNTLWRSYYYKDGKQITVGSSFSSEEEAYNAILQMKTTTPITIPPSKAPLD